MVLLTVIVVFERNAYGDLTWFLRDIRALLLRGYVG
ncbi:hypothetical protein Vsou_19830 [Vulcanisaeta souniana JCM 11219]|uniref:Uncharacterized protein n=1 Tax=Vulcanisaeta souniana JCM 11219 TaxID=1293586 RepID=A0ABN6SSQ7_9CREN|nr:hypothetical protein Vsou_19830 [Vulcanisaeta souniana JCM 11219]